MSILVSDLVKQHRYRHSFRARSIAATRFWIGMFFYPFFYVLHSLLFNIIYFLSCFWNFTYHPIGAYLWLKTVHVAWAMLLAAVNDVRCRGANSIIYPECKIIIHAQSLSLHELFESNYIVLVSIVRLLHATSFTDVAEAVASHGLAYFKLFDPDVFSQFLRKPSF